MSQPNNNNLAIQPAQEQALVTSRQQPRTTVYKMKQGTVNNVDDLITESQETRR